MRRRGLTVVEFVVVLAVVLTVVGLAVVATQSVRNANRRTETINNLKECALAVHAFHDKHRKLPDAFYPDKGDPDRPKSFWVRLLPFVGHAESAEKDEPQVIPAYLAPLDPSLREPSGKVSFAANLRLFAFDTFGAARSNDLESSLTLPMPGMLMSANLTLPRIVDGTSNTFMLATRYAACSGKPTQYAAHPADYGGFFGAGFYFKPPSSVAGDPNLMFQVAPDLHPTSTTACNPEPGVFGHSFGEHSLSVARADGTLKNVAKTMQATVFMRAICPGDQRSLIWSAWDSDD